jgi:hypothetical protein
MVGKYFAAESKFVDTLPTVMSLTLGAVGENSRTCDVLLALVASLDLRSCHSQLGVLLRMHHHLGAREETFVINDHLLK